MWYLRSVLHWGFIPTLTSLKNPFKHGMLATWGLFKASSSCLSPFLSVNTSTGQSGEDSQGMIQLMIQTWLFSEQVTPP